MSSYADNDPAMAETAKEVDVKDTIPSTNANNEKEQLIATSAIISASTSAPDTEESTLTSMTDRDTKLTAPVADQEKHLTAPETETRIPALPPLIQEIKELQQTDSLAVIPVVAHISKTLSPISARTRSEHLSPHLRREMRRFVRRSLRKRRQHRQLQNFSMILLGLLLFGIISPLILTANYTLAAYETYTTISTHASAGIQHLLTVQTIFTTKQASTANPADTNTMLDPTKLKHVDQELAAAQTDFTQLKQELTDNHMLQTATTLLPQFQPQLTTARAASQIGIDISIIGRKLITTGQTLAPRLHGPLLGDSAIPLLTKVDMAQIHTMLDAIQPLVDDIQSQARFLSVDSLPLSDHQRSQLQQALALLPQVVAGLKLGRTLIDPLGWLLGVDQPRTFLVETMDRAELRATGGFTGQYGELHVSGGRVAPLTLQNVALLEYTGDNPTLGNFAPDTYRSWWPFANWGLRDANLSADFPTSAQLEINQYNIEVKHPTDGVIMFTPFLIQHILQVTGPIYIPLYNETVTSQNLEERLHFYQLDNAGILKERIIENVDDNEQARKQFTSRLTHILIDHIRQSSPSVLLALAQRMIQELQTRDLQVYVTNPALEALLAQNSDAGQIDRSTTHDGLYVVQANVSASKASQFVRTTVHDTVSLDASGGATHLMQMRLAYTQVSSVYGLDTYRDYIRIYTPPTAQFRWGNGFDTGVPLCSGPLASCPDDSIYPQDELVCPNGQYHGGFAAGMLDDPYIRNYHPLDEIGPPTTYQSDEANRAMFGGYVVIPKNCTMTITLSWYVPTVTHTNYNLLFQRQVGTLPELDLTIFPPSGTCKAFYFNGILEKDMSFPMKQESKASARCNASSRV